MTMTRLTQRLLLLLAGLFIATVPSAQVRQAQDAAGMQALETTQQISIDRAVAFPVDI